MWNLCRLAALQQLKRNAPSVGSAISWNARLIANAQPFTALAGIEREHLLTRSASELRSELGDKVLSQVRQDLTKEFSEVVKQENVSSDEIKELFTVAQLTGATPVLLRAFDYMEQNYASQMSFTMYGAMFRTLLRAGKGDKMVQIYESAKPNYQSVPEIIFRFGIVGKLELGDIDGAIAIWDEMKATGHETTNEIASRIMMAYARANNTDKVLELYASVDPQIGKWHESAIDRVILTLGLAGQPEKAFDFYVNSSMKLNAGTLMALLRVCIQNNCHQQATDILLNRKRFDLSLDARGYNRIMETLEFLGRQGEIADILTEMKSNNVRFDVMTRSIIERNRDHFQGTEFADLPVYKGKHQQHASDDEHRVHNSSYFASPKIRELLEENNGVEAAAMVDPFLKPLQESEIAEGAVFHEDALKVSPSLAKDAVRAFIATEQHNKVDALLKTFSSVKGNYGHALAAIMTHYGKAGPSQNEDFAYRATKAMIFQGRQIFYVDDAMTLFRKFRDVDATRALFDHVLNEFADAKNATDAPHHDSSEPKQLQRNGKRFSQFNIGKVINMTLQTMVENGQLQDALSAIDRLEQINGLQATSYNYVVIFNSMRDHAHQHSTTTGKKNQRNSSSRSKSLYDASKYELVWDDLKRRNVNVTKSIVGNMCLGFSAGNKRQRLKLLEAYADVKDVDSDKYVLPVGCYNVLLQTTAKEGELSDLKTVYEEAVRTFTKSNGDKPVPREWVTAMIVALANAGELADAQGLLLSMKTTTGVYTYEAMAAVLRAAAKAHDNERVVSLFAFFEEQSFRLRLQDAYDLVHEARQTDAAQLALDAVRVFESAHASISEDDEAAAQLAGATEGAILLHKFQQSPRALQQLRTMYRVTLQICEQNGQWKTALRLRERMADLLSEDTEPKTEPEAHAEPQQ